MSLLSARSEELLTILSCKVRFLSEAQISRTLWNGNTHAASRYLRALRAQDMVARRLILAHPEIALDGPLLSWKPGDLPPDAEFSSYQCKRRWTRPPVRLPVWLATEKAARLLGGRPGSIHLATTTHDLHTGAVLLAVRHRETAPGLRWVREDLIRPERNERLPDLLLTDAENRVRFAVEFGGSAKPERIRKLFAYSRRFSVPWELW